jgi:hypothetical protein
VGGAMQRFATEKGWAQLAGWLLKAFNSRKADPNKLVDLIDQCVQVCDCRWCFFFACV